MEKYKQISHEHAHEFNAAQKIAANSRVGGQRLWQLHEGSKDRNLLK